jgi:hypothetical protein
MLMLNVDPTEHVAFHRQQLLDEIEHQRLLAQLPPHGFQVRRSLALVCARLADWLDEPTRYVQPGESGPEHWATPSASA